MRKLLAIGVFCALTLIVGQVWANVIATRTNPNQFIVGSGAASCAPAFLIPLNAAGSTAMPFVTTQDNQRVVVSFNAECTVKGTTFSRWLNIDVLVDGVLTSPSSNDNAFCTSHGNNILDGWVQAISQNVIVVPEAGVHFVSVQGNLVGCNDAEDDQWRIDDSTTLVAY